MTPQVENMDAAEFDEDTVCYSYSRQAVERFLKSVVVIDNEAYMGAAPPARGNSLDVGAVTREFAKHSINCSVYRPQEGDNIVATCLPLLQQADAAILDWELTHDKSAEPCKELIKQLFTSSQSHGRSIRLVIVYSAETPQDVFDELAVYLSSNGFLFDKNEDSLEITTQYCVVLCMQKKDEHEIDPLGIDPREGSGTCEVKPSELPEYIVDFFTTITCGLVPAIMLHAIASIRERTHELLGTFNSGLDSSFVLHSILIPNKDDSYNFLTSIISDELETIINSDDSARNLTSEDSLCKFIEEMDTFQNIICKKCNGKGYEEKKCKLCNGNEKCNVCHGTTTYHSECSECNGMKEWKITPDSLVKAYRDRNAVKELPNNSSLISTICKRRDDNSDGGLDFCRLTTYRAECESRTREYTRTKAPTLQQGSILLNENENGQFTVYICIIPQCDSVRIKKDGRLFPCIKGVISTKINKANFIIRHKNKDKYIHYENSVSWKNLSALHFNGDDTVVATKDGEDYIFKDSEGVKYKWVATLRQNHALKIASEAIPQLGRIGLDEFEWHRILKQQMRF